MEKLKILLFITFYFIKLNLSKFLYRFISIIFFKKFDNYIYSFIKIIIPDNIDVKYLVDKNRFDDFYPKHYPYKKIKGVKSIQN